MEASRLERHVKALRACEKCPGMHRPAISGGPVESRVMLVGQAPGAREPALGKPFAWTAGRKLFQWLEEHCSLSESDFRTRVYIAAVCRCFPGKHPGGHGDRVPTKNEIARCRSWLEAEFDLLQPRLIIPVGKLAISQFLQFDTLREVVGGEFLLENPAGATVVPLPHPSGASTWVHQEPGKTLTSQALHLLGRHPEIQSLRSFR
ncbi:MAG: uracil-DNA glycosylase family protein [Verrucomicrobiota bacterium]